MRWKAKGWSDGRTEKELYDAYVRNLVLVLNREYRFMDGFKKVKVPKLVFNI